MALTLLPAEIKTLRVPLREKIFYSDNFTAHLQENNNIRLDRKIFSIINKSNNTNLEKWLEKNINNMVLNRKIYLLK